jgi:hypothetical protein
MTYYLFERINRDSFEVHSFEIRVPLRLTRDARKAGRFFNKILASFRADHIIQYPFETKNGVK